MRTIGIVTISTFFLLPSGMFAQQNQTTIPTSTVPRLVRITSAFHPADGQPAGSLESVTLSIYRDEQGGTPLWQETQNVAIDSEGRYNLLMGSTLNDGIPIELFSSSEPRWLGVKFNRAGEIEQRRSRLASVPYALKASDAETLGGRPASEYLLAAPLAGTASVASASTGAKPKATQATSGNPGYIGVFTDPTDLGDSVMYQLNGNIGINTTAPMTTLDARGNPFAQIGMAQTTDYLTMLASDQYGPAIFWDPGKDLRLGKGGTGLYNPYGFTEQMRIQSSTGNVGIGTQSPGQKLDVAGNISMSGVLMSQGYQAFAVAAPIGGNTSVGLAALPYDAGLYNTATGQCAMCSNITGEANTASGYLAMFRNTTGGGNTATGYYALTSNTNGGYNTATGYRALAGNATGEYNTASGTAALASNSGGSFNAAVGVDALNQNTIGDYNTAVGPEALIGVTSGVQNVGIGYIAGGNITGGSNNIEISNFGVPGDNGVIRIGTLGTQTQFFAAGIAGATATVGVPVLVNTATGQLGVATSSRRFKEDIHDMGTASDGLMRLRPVTFRYKQPFDDGTKPIQYGLIAEEVNEVYPDLVAHSADGQIETVKYQVLDSMLLNEVQKQRAEIAALKERLAKIEALLAPGASAGQR